jgi:ribosomal protein S18 acetylase RimI-like enzyme
MIDTQNTAILFMQIRRAIPAESDALSALAFEAKAYWGYADQQLEAWRDQLTISAVEIAVSLTFVAEANGQLLGFYCLHESATTSTLDHFWIAPAHMGRGVGRKLLAHAQSVAQERNIRNISIDADPNAEAFYLACGARRVGALPAPIEGQPNRNRPQLLLIANKADLFC